MKTNFVSLLHFLYEHKYLGCLLVGWLNNEALPVCVCVCARAH